MADELKDAVVEFLAAFDSWALAEGPVYLVAKMPANMRRLHVARARVDLALGRVEVDSLGATERTVAGQAVADTEE